MTFERWLQSRLTAHGYPVGAIDGVIGPITISALRKFQEGSELEPTGTANTETVAALRMSATAGEIALPERSEPSEGTGTVSNVWPRQRDVWSFYGKVGTNQTKIELPFDMHLAWDKVTRVRKMTLHKKVAPSAERVFTKIASIYTVAERRNLGLDVFGGSLNVRRMRGGSNYSMHSWGIAIDFDPERNQLRWGKPKSRLSHPDADLFWQAWEAEGWVSLGRERNFDWMHIQAARL